MLLIIWQKKFGSILFLHIIFVVLIFLWWKEKYLAYHWTCSVVNQEKIKINEESRNWHTPTTKRAIFLQTFPTKKTQRLSTVTEFFLNFLLFSRWGQEGYSKPQNIHWPHWRFPSDYELPRLRLRKAPPFSGVVSYSDNIRRLIVIHKLLYP